MKKKGRLVALTGRRFSSDPEETEKAMTAALGVIRLAEPANALFSEDKQAVIVSLAVRLAVLVQTCDDFRKSYKFDFNDITAATLVHAAAHWQHVRTLHEDEVSFFCSFLTTAFSSIDFRRCPTLSMRNIRSCR